jgi:hypothetical protein
LPRSYKIAAHRAARTSNILKMEATSTSGHFSSRPLFSHHSLVLLAILVTLALAAPFYFSAPARLPSPDRLKMEKSSGKNGKHANPKARERAGEMEKLQKKVGPKTMEDKKALQKLKDLYDHYRRKKDWSGETHSRKSKGK